MRLSLVALAILACLSCGGDPNVRNKPFILTDRGSLGWGAEFATAVYVGTSVPQSLSVQNRGLEDLKVTSVTQSGDNEFAFTLQDLTVGQSPTEAMPWTVAPLKTKFIQLTFAPMAVGRYSGAINIKSNAENVADLKIDLYGCAIKKLDGGAYEAPDGGCP